MRKITELLGLPVITPATGETIGTVADIFFEEDGTLTGYQVSDSILEDLLDGRGFMPMAGHQVIGETTVIVPDSAAENGDICEV